MIMVLSLDEVIRNTPVFRSLGFYLQLKWLKIRDHQTYFKSLHQKTASRMKFLSGDYIFYKKIQRWRFNSFVSEKMCQFFMRRNSLTRLATYHSMKIATSDEGNRSRIDPLTYSPQFLLTAVHIQNPDAY